jgi:Flp pilus assembly protein TadG
MSFMPAKRSKRQNQNKGLSGQALMEFALILPLLLVLIITSIELGRLFFTKMVITNAAREGAFYYSSNITNDHIDLEGNSKLAAVAEANNTGATSLEVTDVVIVPYPGGENSVFVTVSTTVEDLIIVSFVANTLGINTTSQGFPLSSSVEMMLQVKPTTVAP